MLIGTKKGGGDAIGEPPLVSESITMTMAVTGLFLVVIGWIDILVGWYPVELGSPQWEFGAVSATIDALPLPTIGIVTVVLAARARRRSKATILGAAAVGWTVLVLLVGGLLYGLSVPLALTGVPPDIKSQLVRAVVKTSSLGLLYLGFYVWLGYGTMMEFRKPRTQTATK